MRNQDSYAAFRLQRYPAFGTHAFRAESRNHETYSSQQLSVVDVVGTPGEVPGSSAILASACDATRCPVRKTDPDEDVS